ncbi:hypothetical protein Bca101_066280 [Brassica carinata]
MVNSFTIDITSDGTYQSSLITTMRNCWFSSKDISFILNSTLNSIVKYEKLTNYLFTELGT